MQTDHPFFLEPVLPKDQASFFDHFYINFVLPIDSSKHLRNQLLTFLLAKHSLSNHGVYQRDFGEQIQQVSLRVSQYHQLHLLDAKCNLHHFGHLSLLFSFARSEWDSSGSVFNRSWQPNDR
jgi:hypothetical protein